MSTKVLGFFESTESAQKAEQLLRQSGFAPSDIVLQPSHAETSKNTDAYVEPVPHGQTLLIVTADGNVNEDKAILILRESNAVNINEIDTRFRPGALK